MKREKSEKQHTLFLNETSIFSVILLISRSLARSLSGQLCISFTLEIIQQSIYFAINSVTIAAHMLTAYLKYLLYYSRRIRMYIFRGRLHFNDCIGTEKLAER